MYTIIKNLFCVLLINKNFMFCLYTVYFVIIVDSIQEEQDSKMTVDWIVVRG